MGAELELASSDPDEATPELAAVAEIDADGPPLLLCGAVCRFHREMDG